MKSFLSLFVDSFNELKKLRTLTVTGLLIALALIVKMFAIQLTPSIRISFAFIAIMSIGMLFGPFVSGVSGILVDFLSYIIADKTGNPYLPILGIAFFISGMIYGIFLYKKDFSFKNAIISRITSVVLCQVGLNSVIIYLMFVNKNFDITSTADLSSFGVWFAPRLIKCAIQLIPDIALVCLILPVVKKAYDRIFRLKTANA